MGKGNEIRVGFLLFIVFIVVFLVVVLSMFIKISSVVVEYSEVVLSMKPRHALLWPATSERGLTSYPFHSGRSAHV